MKPISHTIILLACVFFTSTLYAEQDKSPKTQNTPVVQLGATYQLNKYAVEATSPAGVTWRHFVATRKSDVAKFRGVVMHQSRLNYCVGHLLYQTSTGGQVHRLIELPDQCELIERKDDQLRVKLRSKRSKLTRWFVVDASTPALVNPASTNVFARFLPQRISWALGGEAKYKAPFKQAFSGLAKTIQSDPKKMAALAHDSALRLKQFEQDPTNPWYLFHVGYAFKLMGKDAQSKAIFNQLLKWDGQHAHHMLRMALQVEGSDNQLADQLFERGLRRLLEVGYTPQHTTSLIQMMLLMGQPPGDKSYKLAEVNQSADAAKFVLRHAKRVEALGPRSEFVYYYWSTIKEMDAVKSDPNLRAKYTKLAKQAKPYAKLGSIHPDVMHTGFWLNVYMAWFFAMILAVLVKLIRMRNTKVDPNAPLLARVNPFARWRRAEIIGFLLALPICAVALKKLTTGIAIMGVVAAAPIGLVDQSFGDLDAQAKLQAMQSTPLVESAMFMGLVQGRYELKAIDAAKPKSMTAMDENNYGVALHRAGKVAQAKEAWTRALALDSKHEPALHNLGKPLPNPSPRFQQLATHQLNNTKVLAYLNTKQLAALWQQIATNKKNPSILATVQSLNQLSADGEFKAMDRVLTIGLVLCILACMLSLLGLFVRDDVEELHPNSKLDAVLAVIVPGTLRQYGVVGFLVTVGTATLLVGFYTLTQNSYVATNILDAIAIPSFGRYFGLHTDQKVFASTYSAMCMYWFVPFVLNVMLVLAVLFKKRA